MVDPRRKFSQIYDRYIDKIYRFVFFKVSSQEIAEDLTSEAFLKTWEVFKKDDQKIENIQAFLYKTTRNLIVDHYREKNKAKVVSAENTALIDPREDLEERGKLMSDVESVQHALANLNENYQNVIIWHYLDDLPIPEIAVILDRTEAATRVLLHRALESLRKKLPEVEKV